MILLPVLFLIGAGLGYGLHAATSARRQPPRPPLPARRRHRDRWPSESVAARVLAGEWEEQEDVTRN